MEQTFRALEDQPPEGELDIERPLVLEPDKQIEEVAVSPYHPQRIVKIGTKLDPRRRVELISFL